MTADGDFSPRKIMNKLKFAAHVIKHLVIDSQIIVSHIQDKMDLVFLPEREIFFFQMFDKFGLPFENRVEFREQITSNNDNISLMALGLFLEQAVLVFVPVQI
jgi:hypothetical protein